MPLYRIYIDKEITGAGGGDHSRVFDTVADDEAAAIALLDPPLDKETVNSVVSLQDGDAQVTDPEFQALAAKIADDPALANDADVQKLLAMIEAAGN